MIFQGLNIPMILRVTGFVLFVVALSSCGETPEEIKVRLEKERAAFVADSTAKADSIIKAAIAKLDSRFPTISYNTLANTENTWDSLNAVFGETKEKSKILATLNRKQYGYNRRADSIVVPSTIVEDLRAYSVFPQYYPAGREIPKIVFISNKYQCYACYENGELVRFAACNTGTERKPTLPGRYACNWKQEMRISSLNENWKLPFTVNFHLYAGNAFHQFDMPGRPVSHSCVRQFMDDAKWMFKWAQVGKLNAAKRPTAFTGTPVIILDMFDFTRPRGGPWRDIESNKVKDLVQLPENPMEVPEALIPISQIPKDARGGLPNRKDYLTADSVLKARGIIRSTVRLSESIDYNKLREQRRASRAQKAKATTPAAAPAATTTTPASN